MDLVSIGTGVALAGAAYFAYLVATKGLPAALAWVKAKWNAGAAAMEGVRAGIESAHARITDLEQEVAKLKAAAPVAPQSQPQA